MFAHIIPQIPQHPPTRSAPSRPAEDLDRLRHLQETLEKRLDARVASARALLAPRPSRRPKITARPIRTSP